jgi:predicted ATPase with chaperone activity
LQAAGRKSKFDACRDIVLCMTQLNLLARAYHRTQSVKLARTIADLAGCENPVCAFSGSVARSPALRLL